MSNLLQERWLKLAFAKDSTTVITEKKHDPYEKCWDGYERVPGKKRDEKGSCRKKEGSDPMGDEGNNLWDNIRAKDKRIKGGSGEKKAKPGDPDYPATLDVNEVALSPDRASSSPISENDEGNAFSGARQDAIDNDEDEFEVGGETFKVKGKKEKTEESLMRQLIRQELLREFDKDKMNCNKPRYLKKGETGYGKKQKVVKACKDGKEKIVKFGDANMKNKSNNKDSKANFRARHNCSDKKDKMKAGYWACKDW